MYPDRKLTFKGFFIPIDDSMGCIKEVSINKNNMNIFCSFRELRAKYFLKIGVTRYSESIA